MNYYETDILLAGGKIETLKRRNILSNNYIARLRLQDWDILVNLKSYPFSHGIITGLVQDNSRSDEECIHIVNEINEYMHICYLLDFNNITQHLIERGKIQFFHNLAMITTLSFAIFFYVGIIMSKDYFDIIGCIISITSCLIIRFDCEHQKRNFIIDNSIYKPKTIKRIK